MKSTTAPAPELRNDEAERAILGRALIDPTSFGDFLNRLSVESFCDPRNRNVWTGIAAVMQQYGSVSRPVLLSQVGDLGEDKISLATYLTGLCAAAAQPEQRAIPAAHLADAVAHPAARRGLIEAAEKIKEAALSAPLGMPIDELQAEAQRLVAANDNYAVHEPRRLGLIVDQVIKTANLAAKSGRPPGIRTGFEAFDGLVGPLLPGQLIVIGGETSSGKTALAMGVAYRSSSMGFPTHVVSLEMTAEELAMRYLAQFSTVSVEDIASCKLSESNLDGLMRAGEHLFDLPLTIDDQPRQSVGMIGARIQREIAQRKCRLAVIDHLQYVRADIRGEERERIAQVVDDIKALAKRLGIPIVLVSHVVRAKQADIGRINQASDIKRPTLDTLYGSSAIEKAGDVVLFVHRPIWFLERNEPLPKFQFEHDRDCIRWHGRAQLVLPKRRMGKGSGIREVRFDEARTWFQDDRQEPDYAPPWDLAA